MKAIKLTPEQIKKDEGREYNPQVWERNVDRYMKYENVEFYKVNKGNGYEYCRYFVVYTLPEGLRLLNTFSYSSSITNGGFQEALITDFDIDTMKPYPNNEVDIRGFRYKTENESGEWVDAWLNNSEDACRWMIERSKKYGCIFTKEGL